MLCVCDVNEEFVIMYYVTGDVIQFKKIRDCDGTSDNKRSAISFRCFLRHVSLLKPKSHKYLAVWMFGSLSVNHAETTTVNYYYRFDRIPFITQKRGRSRSQILVNNKIHF